MAIQNYLGQIKKWFLTVFVPSVEMFFYNTICKFYIELFGTVDRRKLKYNISLCLIFKNEAPFLKEWIDYHLMIGVDHFYLYNNNSDDNYLDIIESYIEKGIITLIDFPYEHAQIKAYKDCYSRFRYESNWISFLDADEFFCPKLALSLPEWLENYSKYPAVLINWVLFGTSGKLKHDYSKPVIEQYDSCWDHFYQRGKCLVNTRYDIANFDTWFVHHHVYMHYRIFGLRFVMPAVNQFKWICTINYIIGGGRDKIGKSSIQINHYFMKAWDIVEAKRKKTDVYYDNNPKKKLDYMLSKEELCVSKNYTIQRFLIRFYLFQNRIVDEI